MSTEYYADYIKKTTFDPKSHSTRSKMEEHHEKDENGKVIEHPIEESMLGMRGSEKLNGGKSKDPRFKSSASHIDYHHRQAGGHELAGGDADNHRYKTAKKLGYQVEAATDVKKKPASKTPKVEVEPTEVPEENLDEKGKGLWANIHAKRARGEKPNPPGHPDRPSAADLKRSQNEELHGDQHKLDHNKDNKIDKADMKMVRKKGSVKNHPMAEKKSLASLRNASVFDGKERLKKMQSQKPEKPSIKPLTTTYQAEATFKVNVEGLPTMYIDGAGAGEIKSSLRKQLKDPKTITSIEKISTSDKKKELRAKVAEEEQVDEISSELAGRAHSSARKQVDYKKTTPTTAKKSDQGTKALAYHQRKAVNPSHTGTSYKGSPGGTDVAAAYKSSSEPARKTSGKYIDKLKKQGIDVSEEEQVDEISNRAKGAYVRVAARDLAHQSSKATSAIYNNDSKDSKRQDIRNADRKRDNRLKGIDRATKGMKNEDAESVDELSRDTLGSYIQKASDASKHKGMSTKKVDNRYSGVSKASKKIDKMEEDIGAAAAKNKSLGSDSLGQKVYSDGKTRVVNTPTADKNISTSDTRMSKFANDRSKSSGGYSYSSKGTNQAIATSRSNINKAYAKQDKVDQRSGAGTSSITKGKPVRFDPKNSSSNAKIQMDDVNVYEDYSDQKAHLKKVGKGGQVSYTNSGKKMSGEYGGLKNKGGRSYAMVHHKTHSAMVPLPQINHKESVEATNEGIMDAISKVKQGASDMVSNYRKKRNVAEPGKGTNYLKK